jgi:hypothetical protein
MLACSQPRWSRLLQDSVRGRTLCARARTAGAFPGIRRGADSNVRARGAIQECGQTPPRARLNLCRIKLRRPVRHRLPVAHGARSGARGQQRPEGSAPQPHSGAARDLARVEGNRSRDDPVSPTPPLPASSPPAPSSAGHRRGRGWRPPRARLPVRGAFRLVEPCRSCAGPPIAERSVDRGPASVPAPPARGRLHPAFLPPNAPAILSSLPQSVSVPGEPLPTSPRTLPGGADEGSSPS